MLVVLEKALASSYFVHDLNHLEKKTVGEILKRLLLLSWGEKEKCMEERRMFEGERERWNEERERFLEEERERLLQKAHKSIRKKKKE